MRCLSLPQVPADCLDKCVSEWRLKRNMNREEERERDREKKAVVWVVVLERNKEKGYSNAMVFLIWAMARPGLRPLGQVLAQFMMVWQRYSEKGF